MPTKKGSPERRDLIRWLRGMARAGAIFRRSEWHFPYFHKLTCRCPYCRKTRELLKH